METLPNLPVKFEDAPSSGKKRVTPFLQGFKKAITEQEGAEGQTPSFLHEVVSLAQLVALYQQTPQLKQLNTILESPQSIGHLKGVAGSMPALIAAGLYGSKGGVHVFVLPDREQAAYLHNDLEALIPDKEVYFLPAAYRKPSDAFQHDHGPDDAQLLLRAEILQQLNRQKKSGEIIVTYAEAVCERVVNKVTIAQNTLEIKLKERLDMTFFQDALHDMGFERTDFVREPGQYALRGGIIDVFSFANEEPYRIELFGDTVDSIRTFDIEDQLSTSSIDRIGLLPNIQTKLVEAQRESFFGYLPESSIVWVSDLPQTLDRIGAFTAAAETSYADAVRKHDTVEHGILPKPAELFDPPTTLLGALERHRIIEFGSRPHYRHDDKDTVQFQSAPQPPVRKDFKLLAKMMMANEKQGLKNLLFADQAKQIQRLYAIFEDIAPEVTFYPVPKSLHEGFVDQTLKIAAFTDHQIFERYHKYRLKGYKAKSQAITLKELQDLKPGDFVTHIDHGVGQYSGLEKLEVNGQIQEAVRLMYRDGDLLYVGLSSLHKIAKYTGKDGQAPKINKIGSDAWEKLKSRTKAKVKDIAKDLIALYAKRKREKGYAFAPDSYLQDELEASFMYEDTPDQGKASSAVKADMERPFPMDRLVCGDVGFGKTEVAIRAAFKAACDGKQVAILVPTTILALQHYKTFKERFADFPVTVDYVNRYRTGKEKKAVLDSLEKGTVDIIVGTSSIVSKEVKFKDLGLMIVDEEQKFGVAVKEKLKQLRINVDTLTLTATPIPRTLQFSLMGARDLSIINTPPPNRHPIQTELMVWDEDRLRDAIMFEVERGGQVFFVHNRVGNIKEMADLIRRLCPGVRVTAGHGQMDGGQLEEVMLSFIEGEQDVLVATNIIESGLDIPNANTIIIHQAQNFGLSDLHQMRGRVGRSNKKAFCYLVVPPLSTLTADAVKRLKAIEDFSDLGSGFNIALRDLDIRGAGNLLGGEQSGFISEIGYELYHKILDEAMQELKETDYRELFADQPDRPFVSDCQVETDWEAHIPDKYVTSNPERLNLYMQLDRIETEEGLVRFSTELEDRFGPLPGQIERLLDVVRVRKTAQGLGIEKLLLKRGTMRATFTSRRTEAFFASETFERVLHFVQANPNRTQLKEGKAGAQLQVEGVSTGQDAIRTLAAMGGLMQEA